MIARILKKVSTSDALAYNEKKEQLGIASKLAVNNLPQGRPDLYNAIFKYYNEDVIVNQKFQNKGFHMTISPGANETMTDEKATEFISEVMKKLGMENQPYIIYKHEDTGHVHYHIVSTLVKLTGRFTGMKIEEHNHFTNLRTLKTLKDLEKDYGYKTGKDPNYESEFIKTPKFDIKKGNTQKQIKKIFEETTNYFYETQEEFNAILLSKNVKTKKKRLKDGLMFFGTDYKGNIITAPQNNIISEDEYQKIEAKKTPLFRNNNKELCKEIEDNVEKALYLTDSQKAFREYLRGKNIDVLFENTKKGGFSEVFYIDNTNKAIFRHSEFDDNVSLARFNASIKARWNTEKKEQENKQLVNKQQRNKTTKKQNNGIQ